YTQSNPPIISDGWVAPAVKGQAALSSGVPPNHVIILTLFPKSARSSRISVCLLQIGQHICRQGTDIGLRLILMEIIPGLLYQLRVLQQPQAGKAHNFRRTEHTGKAHMAAAVRSHLPGVTR